MLGADLLLVKYNMAAQHDLGTKSGRMPSVLQSPVEAAAWPSSSPPQQQKKRGGS